MNPNPSASLAPRDAPASLSPRHLARLTALAFGVASGVMVLVALPAEYGLDPTGFGRATGLAGLHAARPEASVVKGAGASVRDYAVPFRSDTIEIPLAAGDDCRHGCELEYKVRLQAGDSLVYAWSVDGVDDPQAFYSDFHGETPVGPGRPKARVVEYRQSTGTSANGVLIAAIPGVHGWYFQNQSFGPAVVRLDLSGFYELVPPGQYGNLAGIEARPQRAVDRQAHPMSLRDGACHE